MSEQKTLAIDLEREPYDHARNSGDAYLACGSIASDKLYNQVFDLLFRIGKTHTPEAIGLCMHHYVLSALASYPLPRLSPLRIARWRILKRIRNERLLIANTGGVRTHKSDESLKIRRQGEAFVLSGATGFMSMSHVADFALVSAYDDETNSDALCMVPLREQPGLKTELLFEGRMAPSGTARVTFQHCEIGKANVYMSKRSADAASLGMYQRIWFHGLVTAPYLGLASAVLDKVKEICGKTRVEDGGLLSEKDGIITEIGRLHIKLTAAQELARAVGIGLARINGTTSEPLSALHDKSAMAKYVASRIAEEVVHASSIIVGTRGLSNPIIMAAKECIHFGRAHPISEFDAERYFGAVRLGINSREVLRWNR